MKTLYSLTFSAMVLLGQAFGQNDILVIESQSLAPGHDMDVKWEAAAVSAGHTVTLRSQSTLISNAFYSMADVLVISSGVIDLPAAARANIEGFLAQGGHVYLQAEYQGSYSTNQLFADLVTLNGGTFSWLTSVSGNRAPINIATQFGGVNGVVPLSYFWYGATGSGTGVTPALTDSLGNDVGWTFQVPGGGRLTCNTDQDWVRTSLPNDVLLMQNMLEWLLTGTSSGSSLGTTFCSPAAINSLGLSGTITLSGSAAVSDDDLTVEANQLPNGQLAVFLASQTQLAPIMPAGSMGYLCVGTGLVIFNRPGEFGLVSGGAFSLRLPLLSFPVQPGPSMPVMSGETWSFQCWHRDMSGATSTTNLTDAISLTFL